MKNIDLCLSNIFLTVCEYVVTSGNLDKVINFDNFDKILMKYFGMKQKEADAVIDVIKNILKSDTLKKFIRSQIYQKLYRSKELQEHFEQFYLNKNFKIDEEEKSTTNNKFIDKFFDKLSDSAEIEEILDPFNEIEEKYGIIEALDKIDFGLESLNLDMPTPGILNLKNLEKIIPTTKMKLIKRRSSDLIKFELLNKQFQLNIQDFNLSNLEQFYSKLGLGDKTEIREITQKLIDCYDKIISSNLNVNSSELMIGFWFLTRYFFARFNFYLDIRNKQTQFYNIMLARESRFAEVNVEKMIEYYSQVDMTIILVISGFKNHTVFWSGYIDYLRQKDLKKELSGQKKKLRKINKLSKENSKGKTESNRKKIRLNDHKYAIAARLHYKAEVENKSFPELCREAAERYVDKDGNDFTGRSLENLFKSMNEQFGLKDLRKRSGILTFSE